MTDKLPISGACTTALCLAVGWLDEHHAAASVMIAAVVGLATVAASAYSIWCKYHERNSKN
jgi:hypothetical protein